MKKQSENLLITALLSYGTFFHPSHAFTPMCVSSQQPTAINIPDRLSNWKLDASTFAESWEDDGVESMQEDSSSGSSSSSRTRSSRGTRMRKSVLMENNDASIETLKTQILQLGAALDRGQSYNPTSSDAYGDSMEIARRKIWELVDKSEGSNVPTSLEQIAGEWELVFTTVPHGIFRSSPFFLAVQEAFAQSEVTEAFGQPKANLFFKLHELQTCSWGVSKIGRVGQRIDPSSSYLYSEFDTNLFTLTVIPILGWGKLLPTFGGCVITASKASMNEEYPGCIFMEVDYTTSRPVPGLSGLGKWIWNVKVPVGAIWKFLPWNKGRAATCSVVVKYVDEDFRIVEDIDGELFVYTRPVIPRQLMDMDD